MNFKDDNIRDENYCEKINDTCPKYITEVNNAVIKSKEAGFFQNHLTNLKRKLSLLFLFTSTKKQNNTDYVPTINKDETELLINLKEMAFKYDRSFLNYFLKVYPNFSTNLIEINPNIKSNDIFFCALLKLNLQTKEIAIIQKISVRAVEAKKYRIRKKLKISSKDCLYKYIIEL